MPNQNQPYFPLSFSQLNIWSLECAFPGTSINNISTTVRIKGQLDLSLLQQSIHCILACDSSLRTQLTIIDGQVMQYQPDYIPDDFPVYDFCNTSPTGFENWEIAVTRERMPLEKTPLYRFYLFRDTESSGGVLVKLHHIISDGWSQVSICNKISQTYLDLLSNRKPQLEEVPDYQLHVQEELSYMQSKSFARDEQYWRELLSNIEEPSMFKHIASSSVSPVGRRTSFELPQILNHAIFTFCQRNRVSPFAAFYMALAIYFKRISGSSRFCIGVPIFNRTNYLFKKSTGMFVTTLPFINTINDQLSLNQFNEAVTEKWYELLRHQRYPFSKITELYSSDNRLFNIALSYQDSKILQSHDTSAEFSGRWHYCGYQAEQLAIHLTNLKDHQKYAVDYDYLAQFFSEDEIQSLHNNLCQILYEALEDPDKPIYKLNVLSMDLKNTLLYTFNNTDRYIPPHTVYEALVTRSKDYKNRAALICNGERLSYSALLYLASGYASAIDKANLPDNSLVAIMLPRKFDLFAAMVGSLQTGCGYLILSRDIPAERLTSILSLSGAALFITDSIGATRTTGWDGPVIRAEDAESDFFTMQHPTLGQAIPPEKRLAYVVYTSGSTGEPKGVEISHQNLINLAQEMESVYGHDAILSVSNVGFDAFVLESIAALLNGRTIVLPTDEDLESPERLAALINSHAVGFLATTPSRLSAFIKNPAFRKSLSRMESLVCGGEAFPAELLKRLKKLTNARIYNQYGPSETTVGVSIKELSHADKITAGPPMGNCRLYVLDQWLNPLPIGGRGNLYIGGKCVGLGYRNNPELSSKSFIPSPFVTDEYVYSTGDIATWTADGEILLFGRADDQVKLRGLRIELREVSSCIEGFPGVHSAVAKIVQVQNEQVLGAYYCAESYVREHDILAHLATYLPRYMIPAFLMPLPEIPRTANGKVDTAKLPLPAQPEEVSPSQLSNTAATILRIFSNVLDRKQLHGNSDYFLSGGNSLNAMECIVQIEESLGKHIRIADLYACRTAVKLAAFLDGTPITLLENKVANTRFTKAPHRTSYPLSPIQQGIYVQSVLDPSGLTYNMPGAFLLEHALDKIRLEKAFANLIQEDPIFRTFFHCGEDGVSAHVQDHVNFTIEEIQAVTFDEACTVFLRPFDLRTAPLLRAALWQSPEGQHYLFVDVHHIISDGMSTPILLQRLDKAYQTGSLSVQWDFYDCICAPRADLEQSAQQNLLYWKDHLHNLPDPLLLPTDSPRPKQFDFQGNEYEFLLPEKDSALCCAFCKEHGISEFSLFLSAFGILLSAISGREDFLIGAPTAGRLTPPSQSVCGPFINTLPLRLKPSSDLTVQQWLAQIQGEVAGMLDHQQISLEAVIQELDLPRGSQNALYQIMMSQSPVDESAFRLDGQQMAFCPVNTRTVKMDICLELTRKADRYALHFSYATSLFLEETIAFYARCLLKIVLGMVQDPNCTLSALPRISNEDYQTLIEIPNYRVVPFINLPLQKMLRNRASALWNKTAVIFHNEYITYEKIEKRAAAIAQFLVNQGLQSGQSVGLCLSRSPDMICAMYGVLKAGGSFTFLLSSFPAARSHYMLKSACSAMMLCDPQSKAQLPEDFWQEELPCPVYLLPDGEQDHFEDRHVSDDHLANILFTSGSTGQPKGVMLRHRAVSNLYLQVQNLLAPYPGNVLCSTNSVFDCFLMETLVALALGRVVVLADEEEMMLPWKLAKLISNHNTAVFEMTPARLLMCLNNDAFCEAADHIRVLLVGGEALTKTLQQKFHAHSSGNLINMYGPSESTIYTTFSPLKPEDPITIGKPLENIRTYVLDDNLQPVLPTACGELYIAGECLAAGYVSRPDLTEAAFFEDIYFPGERMYRSGDLVRQRVDGSYDFMGRKDSQVKLNGQRVELSEISCAILESGLVEQAATVAIRKADCSMELCAFYVAQGAIDKEGILTHIRRVLPPYMIPSQLLQIPAMPMTASNKIDLLKLQKMAADGTYTVNAMEVSSVSEEITVPTERSRTIASGTDYILSVWNQVLRTPITHTNVSFFAHGGTSMDALSVLSCYYNDNYEMSLAEFYENPTAAMQARLLGGDSNVIPNASYSVVEAPSFVPASTVATPPIQKIGHILVTGATGFFGAHLIRELLMQAPSHTVLCLMRDGNKQRLHDRLAWYFGQGFAQQAANRIEVITGDITKPLLGLSADAHQQLADRIGQIYHSAADVRHYAADTQEYLQTNVDGTKNMLALARAGNATFYHISTCSVSGDRLRGSDDSVNFAETDYDIGQDWESNIYVRSKFLAEGHVHQATANGMQAKVFRLGRLVGRMSDGVFQCNPQTNAFYLLMQSFFQIGVLPESSANIRIDLMPIDLCVREVLALTNAPDPVYHILNSTPPTLRQIVEAFSECLRIVSDTEFDQIFEQKRHQMDPELLGIVMDYLHRSRYAPGRITPTNVLTEHALASLNVDTSVQSVRQILLNFLS